MTVRNKSVKIFKTCFILYKNNLMIGRKLFKISACYLCINVVCFCYTVIICKSLTEIYKNSRKHFGIIGCSVVIEVTESVLDAQHLQQALTSLHALHQLGVEIHIDDFGTGYSSLSRLREFPVHAIKIDKSFALSGDVRSMAVIEGAVLIAHRFGLRVIAEGIESAEQASALALLGVDELQGYWFGRPSAQGPGSAAEG